MAKGRFWRSATGIAVCPDSGKQSSHRHGWHERHLQDLPAQGAAVTVELRIQRWQCRNKACKRQTFAGRLPEIAAPLARRIARAAELVHLFGHGVGRRPGERLLKRIGMPISAEAIVRVLGVDDGTSRKGSNYRNHHRRPGAATGDRPFVGSFGERDSGLAQATS